MALVAPSTDTIILNLINEVLKVSQLEIAFNCVNVHNLSEDDHRFVKFKKDLTDTLTPLTPEQKENAIRQYLNAVSLKTNINQLQFLLRTIVLLVQSNVIPAKMVCEQILLCEQLRYQNSQFWILCFQLIRKILAGVDYKGVREIMKGCRDKAVSFPYTMGINVVPQMLAVEEVLKYIFDRNSCLLPAYFIVNELLKPTVTHWRIHKLISKVIEEFRNVAQMVTIIGQTKMLPIVEHFGYVDSLIIPWRLDATTLKLNLRGVLPYDPDIYQPQTNLLNYIIEQSYSKDMLCSMLNLQKQHKQRCIPIENGLVELIMLAMERSEREVALGGVDNEGDDIHYLWVHISSQLIYFILFQFASFPNIVLALYERLQIKELRKGRDYLMWALLQFISGSIQRNPLSNFVTVLNLYDVLYAEKEPLPVPDCTKSYCARQMAPACIWLHLHKKAQSEHIIIQRTVPIALKNHNDFFQHLMISNTPFSVSTDYITVLMCNAFSTNQEFFTRPMAALVDTINKTQTSAGSNVQSLPTPTVPLTMTTLDSLTVHAKMSLIHNIVTHMIKQSQTQTKTPIPPLSLSNMAPALVETYSRLLVYTEIESLGIKGFLTQLLPAVFKSHAWSILHTLLEMLSHRVHHIQPFYRVQLLSHLHSLNSVPQTNHTQLHLCVESTALRLIHGLGSAEVQPQLTRYFTEPKLPGSVVSVESEELNRALVLTLARAMHVTGTGNDDQIWCKDLLTVIMQNTPHTWSAHCLECFPPYIRTFFEQNATPKDNKQQLKKSVDEEYRNWDSMSNENDIIAHFSVAGQPPLFLCLLFKVIGEKDCITPVAYKILERIGARSLSAHLRKLCDYLIFEVVTSNIEMYINKCADIIYDMIWKYHIFTIDRLVLCLTLRSHEGNESHISFFIRHLLILRSPEFRNHVHTFVKDNSPDYWKQSNWHEKHIAFTQKLREKFVPDESVSHVQFPVYFGNVCLRFLPVLDILIHRFLEQASNNANKSLDSILEHLGCLYKFHDRPITYLYNTLHYYERILRDRPFQRKRFIGTVIGALADIRPADWALTKDFLKYLQQPDIDGVLWQPELVYYINIVRRFVNTINGKSVFYLTDWRFNEFPNAPAHGLYITCVELMGLPIAPSIVTNKIIDSIVIGYAVIPQDEVHNWINAVGILLATLPEPYWVTIYDRVAEVLQSSQMETWSYRFTPYEMFSFKTVEQAQLENSYVLLLAIVQSMCHHSLIGNLAMIADLMKEKLKPFVYNEQQLIYVCHLAAPFIGRLDAERPRVGYEVTTLFYELLEQVDKKNSGRPLNYMDNICDLLYHIKYMYVGDILKSESEAIIRRLRPQLQLRLRFITHLNVDEITSENNLDKRILQTLQKSNNSQQKPVQSQQQQVQVQQQVQQQQQVQVQPHQQQQHQQMTQQQQMIHQQQQQHAQLQMERQMQAMKQRHN